MYHSIIRINKKKYFYLFILITCFAAVYSNNIYADSDPTEIQTKSNFEKSNSKFNDLDQFKNNTIISKNSWITQFSILLKSEFCQPQSYYIKCFEYKKTNCEETFKDYFNNCYKQSKLPEKISIYENGIKYAENISTCIGKNWTKKNNLKSDVNCNVRE